MNFKNVVQTCLDKQTDKRTDFYHGVWTFLSKQTDKRTDIWTFSSKQTDKRTEVGTPQNLIQMHSTVRMKLNKAPFVQ